MQHGPPPSQHNRGTILASQAINGSDGSIFKKLLSEILDRSTSDVILDQSIEDNLQLIKVIVKAGLPMERSQLSSVGRSDTLISDSLNAVRLAIDKTPKVLKLEEAGMTVWSWILQHLHSMKYIDAMFRLERQTLMRAILQHLRMIEAQSNEFLSATSMVLEHCTKSQHSVLVILTDLQTVTHVLTEEAVLSKCQLRVVDTKVVISALCRIIEGPAAKDLQGCDATQYILLILGLLSDLTSATALWPIDLLALVAKLSEFIYELFDQGAPVELGAIRIARSDFDIEEMYDFWDHVERLYISSIDASQIVDRVKLSTMRRTANRLCQTDRIPTSIRHSLEKFCAKAIPGASQSDLAPIFKKRKVLQDQRYSTLEEYKHRYDLSDESDLVPLEIIEEIDGPLEELHTCLQDFGALVCAAAAPTVRLHGCSCCDLRTNPPNVLGWSEAARIQASLSKLFNFVNGQYCDELQREVLATMKRTFSHTRITQDYKDSVMLRWILKCTVESNRAVRIAAG